MTDLLCQYSGLYVGVKDLIYIHIEYLISNTKQSTNTENLP